MTSKKRKFLEPTPLKPATRKKSFKSSVPTTCLNRILDSNPVIGIARPPRGMYASGLAFDNWTSLGDLVEQFWLPEREEETKWWLEIICKQGDLVHDTIQNSFWQQGLLHQMHDGFDNDGEPCFQEIRIVDDFYNIRGKIDLLIALPEYLKKIGARTPPKQKIDIEKYCICDIKTVFQSKLDEIQDATSDSLTDKYKAQLTFYHDYCIGQGWADKDSIPAFIFVSRDDSRKIKYIEYEPEQRIRDLIHKNVTDFWKCIRDHRHPEIENFEPYIEEQMAKQVAREIKIPPFLG